MILPKLYQPPQDAQELANDLKSKVCFFNKPIPMSDECHRAIVNKVDGFADKMSARDQSASYYETHRNASTPLYDIRIGKYGEFAAALYFRSLGFPKILPDIEVRSGFTKGWDCDLPFGKDNLNYPNSHVKTCDEDTCNFVRRARGDQYTWTFQFGNRSGRGGRDELFSRPDSNEPILFMYVAGYGSQDVRLIATAPWKIVHSLLGEPISPKLHGLKKCVYYADLARASNR